MGFGRLRGFQQKAGFLDFFFAFCGKIFYLTQSSQRKSMKILKP